MKRNKQRWAELCSIGDWPDRARKAGYKVRVLAQECGVPEKVLQEFFRMTAGCSAHAYLILLRRTVALELLQRGDMCCKEIAAQAGYMDATQFSRDMKNWSGCSPTELWAGGPDFSI